jgi:hypothetical protein
MQAFDTLGKELFIGDVVATTVPVNSYGTRNKIIPARVVRLFESKPTYGKPYTKVTLEAKGRDKMGVDPTEKCMKLEGFDYDAYLADL